MHEGTRRHQRHPAGAGFQRGPHGLEPAVDVVVAHAAVDEPGKEVVLAPHHALGHARRAAGVEHVEVVSAAAPRRAHPPDGGLGGVLVGGGPVGTRARPVVDPEPALHAGHAVEDALDPVGERAMENDCHRVGVLPQIAQLVVAVAIVGVDGDEADLERGEGGLDVLGRVVQVDRHLVLLDGAEIEQELRDAVGPAVELVPPDVAVALGHGDRLGLHVRHRLPHVCVVPVSHDSLHPPPRRSFSPPLRRSRSSPPSPRLRPFRPSTPVDPLRLRRDA